MGNRIVSNNPYKTLVNYDGLYESPKDGNGNYQGPVVAYAGIEPTTKKNYVGFAYFNIAKVEQDPEARSYFADRMADAILDETSVSPTIIIGAPMGGIVFATSTADILGSSVAFFEKKVVKLADPANHIKEESELVFNRHDIGPEDKVILFEDLCNNFSTTDKMIKLIESKGAEIIGIACIFNRSDNKLWNGIPVISVIHKHTPEYKQTDSEVKDLVEAGNVVWKPKAEWKRLKEAMNS